MRRGIFLFALVILILILGSPAPADAYGFCRTRPSDPRCLTPITPTPAVVSPSGQAMPLGNLPGWRQIYGEDFGVDAAVGSFLSVYGPH